MDYADAIHKATVNNRRLNSVISEFEFITEIRITYHNTTLVNYMSLLYDRALYNTLQGYWHASPGLIAILASIWGVLVIVWNALTFVIDLLKIKEILQIAEILRIIWPEFRSKYDAILGKVSEFSAQLGWGVDGIIHLIQAAQGGLNMMKGLTGKSFEWLTIAGAEKAIRSLEYLGATAHTIADDPAHALDLAFFFPSEETSRDVESWWNGVTVWLEETSDNALLAIQTVNDTIDNLRELENNLPEFIKNHIPQNIWDSINWVDEKIDNTILPALSNINNQFTEINADLLAEREKAALLAIQLLRPGDLLENVDVWDSERRHIQELKIDDITSRIYEEQTDEITAGDSEIIEQLASVQGLAQLELSPPLFTQIETGGRPGIIYTPAEKVTGWFVGDF